MPAKLKRDTILGLVFFSGILLLLWATAALSEFSLGEKIAMHVSFPDGRMLKQGDNVYLLGTKVGIVRGVAYDPSQPANPIKVTLELDKKLTFRPGYKVAIVDSSFLGGKQISISPGREGTPIDLSTTPLIGVAQPNPLEALGQMIGGDENRANLTRILSGVASIIDSVESAEGTLGKLIKEAKIYDDAAEFMTNLNASFKDARAGKGTLGKFLVDEKLYDEATNAMTSVNKAVTAATEGDGMIARLLHDKQLADNVEQTIADLRVIVGDLSEGRGLLGKVLRDEKTAADFTAIVDGLKTAVAAFNEGDGLVAALLHDKKLRADATGLVADFRVMAANLRAGKGTIGRLLADDTIANNLERLLRQISRTVEDAREAAPVSTFVSIFTGSLN